LFVCSELQPSSCAPVKVYGPDPKPGETPLPPTAMLTFPPLYQLREQRRCRGSLHIAVHVNISPSYSCFSAQVLCNYWMLRANTKPLLFLQQYGVF